MDHLFSFTGGLIEYGLSSCVSAIRGAWVTFWFGHHVFWQFSAIFFWLQIFVSIGGIYGKYILIPLLKKADKRLKNIDIE